MRSKVTKKHDKLLKEFVALHKPTPIKKAEFVCKIKQILCSPISSSAKVIGMIGEATTIQFSYTKDVYDQLYSLFTEHYGNKK